MLTVDFGRLRLGAGDRLLDLGCGGGRHAFEAVRLGAEVVAVDADAAEVKDVKAWFAALALGGTDSAAGTGHAAAGTDTGSSAGTGQAMVADACRLPFPDASFDRVVAAEVLEHIPDDVTAMSELARVLRPGGTMAVTVPRWLPELVCWALSSDYHETPGGHRRIYRGDRLRRQLSGSGLRPYGQHHAHALHSPYWWLRCAVGVGDDKHPLVRAYHRLLVWDITAATPLTRLPERALNPLLGKSLVVYLEKPSAT